MLTHRCLEVSSGCDTAHAKNTVLAPHVTNIVPGIQSPLGYSDTLHSPRSYDTGLGSDL